MNTYRHNTRYYNYRHNIDLSARRLLPAIHLYSVMMGWRVGEERGGGRGEGSACCVSGFAHRTDKAYSQTCLNVSWVVLFSVPLNILG